MLPVCVTNTGGDAVNGCTPDRFPALTELVDTGSYIEGSNDYA